MNDTPVKNSSWFHSRIFWGLLLLTPPAVYFGMFQPCMAVRDDVIRMERSNSLHDIGAAIQAYHKIEKCLPPRALCDKNGKPLLSWRVLLLPYLGRKDLYDEFHLDESWDSPHNLTLLPKMPKGYCFPGAEATAGLTQYQVLIGPGTAFERPGLTFDDITDGLPETILVIEAATAVPWTKPADLEYDPQKQLPEFYMQNYEPAWYDSGRKQTLLALMANGTVRQFWHGADATLVRALITRNGGEKLPKDW